MKITVSLSIIRLILDIRDTFIKGALPLDEAIAESSIIFDHKALQVTVVGEEANIIIPDEMVMDTISFITDIVEEFAPYVAIAAAFGKRVGRKGKALTDKWSIPIK